MSLLVDVPRSCAAAVVDYRAATRSKYARRDRRDRAERTDLLVNERVSLWQASEGACSVLLPARRCWVYESTYTYTGTTSFLLPNDGIKEITNQHAANASLATNQTMDLFCGLQHLPFRLMHF